jgi:alpha-tubulin suppressor-like RCC1 family protein
MKVWRVVFTIVVSCAIAGASLVVQEASATPSGFIQRQGAQLTLNGQPFRFTGLNIYNANSNGSCAADMQSGSSLDDAFTAMGSGVTVIRAWFFQSFATTNGQRDWTYFDHTLSVAAAHNIRVIPVFANQWPDCEPASGYKDETWYETGYTQQDPSGTVSYRDFVAEVVARYADDPTVAFWQLMNEPQVTTDSTSGICSANAEGLLASFATDVSGLVKSLDQNHLVSLGSIGSGQCGQANDDYRQIHAIPTIDLCEFHDYDPTALIPGDQWNGMQVRFDQCAQLNKPLFVGELGTTPTQAGGGLTQRAQLYAAKLHAQFDAGSVGELLWAWYEAAPPNVGSLDIHRSDPALGVLADAFTPNITSIGSGPFHTCVTTTAGTVKCWGYNNAGGALGDGTMINRNRPVDVIGISSGATAVDGGSNHTCALVGSTVECWGSNGSGEIGQGTTGGVFQPTVVTGLTDPRSLTAGGAHACALQANGQARCWGSSGSGQLGSGFPVGSGVYGPATVNTASPLQQLAAESDHTCATTVSGGAKCWGNGGSGQLGDNDPTNTSPRANPVDVVGLTSGVIQVAAGNAHSCALTVAKVRCWGNDQFGQLGDGQQTSTNANSPVDVMGLPSGIRAIAAGGRHTCAITAQGGLMCWGDNQYGQLGNNSQGNSAVPVQVTGMTSGVVAVTLGDRHTCALKDDGSVWCWGNNQYGQLGNRSFTGSLVPQQVSFAPVVTYALTVKIAGTGTGTVHTDQYEIYCTSGTCSQNFDQGSVVTLTEQPDSGSAFAGWSGGGCSGKVATCQVTMSQARTVTATFTAVTGPSAPTNVTATPGNAQAVIKWGPPTSNGGSAITGYVVTLAAGTEVHTTPQLPASARSTTVTGLTNGREYTVTVYATNAGSQGTSSNPIFVTPRTTPGVPTSVTCQPGNTTVDLSWLPPSSDGGSVITRYEVFTSDGIQRATVNVGPNPPTPISTSVAGLANGKSYKFKIRAINAAGNGAFSPLTGACVPVGPPGAATGVVSSGVDGMALVSWTAPTSTGGSAIQTYTVTASPGGQSITVQAPITSAVVRGLTNGTPYSFSVVATNALGSSAPASTGGTAQPTAGTRAIAFTSTRTDSLGQDIYLMDEAGTVTVQLIRRSLVDTAPRFSPDHSQIAFTSFKQGTASTSDIWLMNVDGTGLQLLTPNNRDDGYANWSPDGTKLVFASNRTQDNGVTQSDREIWVMNADGTGTPKELTRTASTVPDEYPDWSPDGASIVFSSIRGGETDSEIYVMNASDGTNVVKLTSDQLGGATVPVWSEGSQPRIAYTSREPGGVNVIHVMDPNGSNDVNVSQGSFSEFAWSWSANGSQILFESTRARSPQYDVFRMNVDGSAKTRLTFSGSQNGTPDW